MKKNARLARLDFTFGQYPADGWCQQPGADMSPDATEVNGMPGMRSRGMIDTIKH